MIKIFAIVLGLTGFIAVALTAVAKVVAMLATAAEAEELPDGGHVVRSEQLEGLEVNGFAILVLDAKAIFCQVLAKIIEIF